MILVVDDDRDVREMLCDVLAAEGYRAAGARNGAEALSMIRSAAGDVDLVLLDLMMPVMSGFQFIEQQRSDPRLARIPVAVMSARWEAKDALADLPFLRKPMHVDEVLAVVRSYCTDPGR